MMIIKYRVIEANAEHNYIVIRYFSDVLTEKLLSVNGVEEALDIPLRCRTDVTLSIPAPTPTKTELNELIKNGCPKSWFFIQEKLEKAKVLNSQPDPIISGNIALINEIKNSNGDLIFDTNTIESNEDWILKKREEISQHRDNLIYFGGFKIIVNNKTEWLHSNFTSADQHLGLVCAALLAKSNGEPDQKILNSEPWTTMDGSTIIITVGVALDLLDAKAKHQSTMYKYSITMKAKLEKSKDARNFDIKVGWPETFQTRII